MPCYDEPYWEGFWDFLNQTKLPLDFHIGGSAVFDAFLVPWKSFGPEKSVALASSMFYMSNAGTVGNFLLSGLFDKYPNVKIASTESGVGWIPFLLEALEYQFDEMVATERVNMKRRPKEYFMDHIYWCFWFEGESARNSIEYLGGRGVMFETDFPHPTCLHPVALEYAAKGLAGLKPEYVRMAMQDNAAELYHINV